MKLIKARYYALLRSARLLALHRAIGPTEAWRTEAIETLSERVRMSYSTSSSVLIRLAEIKGEDINPDALRPMLRDLAALTPGQERAGLPPAIRSAIQHFDYATSKPVTPGLVMRVLIYARLIYRAWRQDV